jgi:predicted DNA-binding transcriptional regulator YafY
MSRAERLLELLQVLRGYKRPVTSERLANKLGISVRTLYRDVASLQAQGADIQGEPGLGYVLKPGYTLPPLMFTHDEIEALVLGSRWVAERTDHELAAAARQVITKISAVLPSELRVRLETSALLVGPTSEAHSDSNSTPDDASAAITASICLLGLRRAINQETKVRMIYGDAKGELSKRTVWPFAIGFFQEVQMIVAWCETREDYRHFRIDRISTMRPLAVKYPRRRLDMLKDWRTREGIAESEAY